MLPGRKADAFSPTESSSAPPMPSWVSFVSEFGVAIPSDIEGEKLDDVWGE